MKLGEFRRLTADLPDDADVVADLGDLEFMDTWSRGVLPPALGHPHAVWLTAGHVVNFELDLDPRVDASPL